jgi:hypothetical protein
MISFQQLLLPTENKPSDLIVNGNQKKYQNNVSQG